MKRLATCALVCMLVCGCGDDDAPPAVDAGPGIGRPYTCGMVVCGARQACVEDRDEGSGTSVFMCIDDHQCTATESYCTRGFSGITCNRVSPMWADDAGEPAIDAGGADGDAGEDAGGGESDAAAPAGDQVTMVVCAIR